MQTNNKLRETLAEIRLLLTKVPMSIKSDIACGIINAKVKRALTEPLRNCDLYATKDEASKAFIVWYNTIYDLNGDEWNEVSSCDLKHNVDGILHEYINWLFAEAKEDNNADE